MGVKNDSLIEIALSEMSARKRPRTLLKITKDVFDKKGLNIKTEKDLVAQFQMDFMLSGHFICIGENRSGTKIWDLKNRQLSSLLDKDGRYLDEVIELDEDVAKHELTDEVIYDLVEDYDADEDDVIHEDDEDDLEDEISEELEEDDLVEDEDDIEGEDIS